MTGGSSTVSRAPPPHVVPSYGVRSLISLLLSPSLLRIVRSFFSGPITLDPPLSVRLLIVALVVANWRSLPLVWHYRVFYPAVAARAKARASIHPLLPFIPSSSHPTTASEPKLRLDKLPLGRDLFDDFSTHTLVASLDDCDFNGHLSNSCYAKALDYTRMTWISQRFLKMHFDGAWMALGGSAFAFHKEIPALARYQIRMGVEAWDDKWFYVVGRFVSPAAKSPSSTLIKVKEYASSIISPATHRPNSAKSASSLSEAAATDPASGATGSGRSRSSSAAASEVVYCTSVSRYCFKSGRRTIPPWLILASSGYGTWASTRTNWTKAEELRAKVLRDTQREHRAKTGRELPRDGIIAGGGYRKAGFLTRYRLESERTGSDDERWMDKADWQLDEFEERRLQGFERLKRTVGGVVPASSSLSSSSPPSGTETSEAPTPTGAGSP
ncbi:uncharacterized protein PFL1_04153 [Pseudozyma flocculosa PF-1]|uniref:Thioesterase n=2 Tax=Pseudozyma flocculosa TaxID=84751 RepID=A0A5C3EV86_9BASI|nr:uncharacterized protein PFL1_04153 [Pseudozyma flocculosa PF-1]EPQ28326.1 hypothetical protein PFL1_04153 [Pseudozyma flocculosa PF-1]SPO35476.1 uncharacterized protein PSFLO_00947 [Pseudozyma flocculosa]